MRTVVANHVRFLFQTSPEIEAMPLHKRPRFLASVIGGMVVCKLGAAVLIAPEVGLSLLPVTLAGGTLATAWRYRAWRAAPVARPGFLTSGAGRRSPGVVAPARGPRLRAMQGCLAD